MAKTLQKPFSKNISEIEDKLFITRIKPDTESHLKINSSLCNVCTTRECTRFCPANVFQWSKQTDNLVVAYENCIECTACKIGCPYKSIDYTHPKSGYGLI